MDELQYAFLDEFGNDQFDFNQTGVSTHYIIVSILIKESNKERLEQEVEQIFKKNIQASGNDKNMKTKNTQQTIQILNQLIDLPFRIYAYVIDKRKIREDSGIMHKTPFKKYLNKMIYTDLNRTFVQLDLVADDQETKPFLREFRNYIKANSIPDLFQYSTFGFNNSQSDALLQLANLITDIFAAGYDTPQRSEHYRSFFKIIKSKFTAINFFPQDYKNFLFDYKLENQDAEYNEIVIKQAVNLTYSYIEKHQKSEEDEERLRLDFLKFLLFNLKESPDQYVYTQEILDNLNAIRDPKINQHYFRSNIVSKLRDSGLLIASSNKGYKLPASLNDLYDFVNLSSLNILPMIQRVAKCRDQILQATGNEIDILNQKEYNYLKRIIDMANMKV